jgi:hypothetical protein
LLFNLRYDFPTEWSAFVKGSGDFAVTLQKDYFPYMVQSATQLTIDALTLYADSGGQVVPGPPQSVDLGALSSNLSSTSGTAPLSLPPDQTVMIHDPSQQSF